MPFKGKGKAPRKGTQFYIVAKQWQQAQKNPENKSARGFVYSK
jgi:hypothetical protein